MNQILLKDLNFNYLYCSFICVSNIPFITYPRVSDCLKYLTELSCCSNIPSKFFYRLSQICHHIQTLKIQFEGVISNGLSELISAQHNLTILNVFNDSNSQDVIMSTLSNLPNTLIKLDIDLGGFYLPLSFISKFTILQELILSFFYHIEYFKDLQHVTFPHLQILKFHYACPNHGYLTKFLENNGKNLTELYIYDYDMSSLNLAIAKFCPNLRSLCTISKNDEIETLKMVFYSCQHLESIEVRCDYDNLNESKILETIANHSPKKFYELKIYYASNTLELFPEELEPVFKIWANRIPQIPLSLIITRGYCVCNLEVKKENMIAIEKFKRLGVIKKFEIK